MTSRGSRQLRRALALLTVAALVSLLPGAPALAAPAAPPAVRSTALQDSCGSAAAGEVRCLSQWQVQERLQGRPRAALAASGPATGLRPRDIRSAYRLPASGSKNQTVAIVIAYDNPRVEQDLAVYRSAFGLPACTAANGCFRKVDQRGGTRYPRGDAGWGIESSLDVQAVSAACSTCRILLVEADNSTLPSMGAAVNTAVKLGATVVSNSYGADEFPGMQLMAAAYYTHPGVPILAASGDDGFTTASFPAVLKTTWAVGGTRLSGSGQAGWTETAWKGSGSGCSAYVRKPARQKDTICRNRTVADVSAAADAVGGFAVYDTYGLGAGNGWINVRGTSLSSPLLAGMIGLAGNATTVAAPSWLYQHRSGLKDVLSGSNGSCGGDLRCTAGKGYDAPTGLGSPRGLSSL